MSDINVVYKGSSIATMDATGNKTIETGGKYCEDDITIEYTRPSGGGGASENAVNFIDYDGTIVQSYSAADFANLSAMPENPYHAGLTAQGWNWELSDAKTHVAKYGLLDIGQMYITNDGKTRVYIHLEEGRTSPVLGVCVNGTVDVDWGDNTAHDTLTGTSTASSLKWTPTHNYSAPGDYVIKLTVTGGIGLLGDSSDTSASALLRHRPPSDVRTRAYHGAIKKIELGSNVTTIEDNAFQDCHALTNITIPEGITNIRSAAFQSCSNLTNVIIPKGVIGLGTYAFSGCYKLKNVSMPKSVTSIGSTAFQYNRTLTRITIPEGVTSIGGNTFYNCHNLISVTIPESVTSIGANTFNGCHTLTSITIPEGITSISSGTFKDCRDLTNVAIPESVTSIGASAFNGCEKLTNVTIPEGVTSIAGSAFYNCYNLINVTIPESVTSIGDSAFQNCFYFSNMLIPEGVTSIGSNAFQYCANLISVTIPESVTSIGSNAFDGCINLINLTISEGVTSIGNYAFQNCSNLISVTIPESVTSIGNYAFTQCGGVKEYHLLSSTPPKLNSSASSSAFGGKAGDCVFYVPVGSLETYQTASNWSAIASYIAEEPA